MPADLNKPGTYFEISAPACPGDTTELVLCKCDSPQAVASVVLALCAADREKPSWVKVTVRTVTSS